MVHYFYKNEYKSVEVYIDCHWLNSVDLSQETDEPICDITLTDRSNYWSGTVTRQGLNSFVRKDTAIGEISKVVTAGLQGQHEYEGQPLKWKVTTDHSTCKLALLSFMGGKLPYELGCLEIPAVPEEDREKVMREWLDNTMEQFAEYRKIHQTLLARNDDLADLKESMKKQIETLERDKLDADFSMFHKFKDILNSKKRRIRKLIIECDRMHRAQAVVTEGTQQSQQSGEAGVDSRETTPVKTEAVGKKRKRQTQNKQDEDEDRTLSQTPIVGSSSSSDTDADDGRESDITRTKRRVIFSRSGSSSKEKSSR